MAIGNLLTPASIAFFYVMVKLLGVLVSSFIRGRVLYILPRCTAEGEYNATFVIKLWLFQSIHKYEFASINHASGDILEQKRSPTKITPMKPFKEPEDIKSTSSKVTNPYKTQVSTKMKEITYKNKKCKDEGSPFSLIKKQNKLYFFSYDPRGYPTDPFPNDYCKHCRCPINYCTVIVFGEMSMTFAEMLAYTSGPRCTEERSDMNFF